MAKLWALTHTELLGIKTLQQFGKHRHGANQLCFAGFNSLQNSKTLWPPTHPGKPHIQLAEPRASSKILPLGGGLCRGN
jgi:hypothetical protein